MTSDAAPYNVHVTLHNALLGPDRLMMVMWSITRWLRKGTHPVMKASADPSGLCNIMICFCLSSRAFSVSSFEGVSWMSHSCASCSWSSCYR